MSIRDNFYAVIMDINFIKGISGIEALKKIRKKNRTIPIIMLSAKDYIEDIVTCLNNGADDYMVKPCDFDELDARIKRFYKRNLAFKSNDIQNLEQVLQHNDIKLYVDSHVVKYKDKNIFLSRKEFILLKKLLENKNRVLSKNNLSRLLYGWNEKIESNALEVHVHNLRKKLYSKLIRTIRGIGYLIEENS